MSYLCHIIIIEIIIIIKIIVQTERLMTVIQFTVRAVVEAQHSQMKIRFNKYEDESRHNSFSLLS